jgi:hypothetical protein
MGRLFFKVFFRQKKMKKRKAAVSGGAPRLKRERVGVPYLVAQVEELMKDNEYIVEVDEADATLWTVYLPSVTLKAQDNTALAVGLEEWATKTGHPPCITLEIKFPTEFPNSVSCVLASNFTPGTLRLVGPYALLI